MKSLKNGGPSTGILSEIYKKERQREAPETVTGTWNGGLANNTGMGSSLKSFSQILFHRFFPPLSSTLHNPQLIISKDDSPGYVPTPDG
jgi:hypothetical protein